MANDYRGWLQQTNNAWALPYVAIASKVQIDPSKTPQENAELVANALKANLMAKAKQMRLEHVSQQAAAEEATRLEEIVPTEQGFRSPFSV